MINLMYVVLMAMLALNVSSDVLKGFALVEESLSRTADNVSVVNKALFENFQKEMAKDPETVGPNFQKAKQVRAMSDSLYALLDTLKMAIAREADGDEADVHNLQNPEDLEAAPRIMLAPRRGKGKMLCEAINSYRTRLIRVAQLNNKRLNTLAQNLSTEVPEGSMGKNWQEYMFEDMPAAAAITMLTKIQNDLRYAEGEVLHSLAATVGVKDTLGIGKKEEPAAPEPKSEVEPEKHHGKVGEVPVNELTAFVVPTSRTIVQGGKFSAEIVMAAVDRDRRPTVYVGGRAIQGSHYEVTCNSVGEFTLSGHISMPDAAGKMLTREFTEKYTVVAPSATVSADLMNVLYAGYENPVSISVPGVSLSSVSASLSGGGSITSNGPGKFIVKPTTPGQSVTIVVTANSGGTTMEMGKYTFRVRKLPDPMAFINVGGEHVFGGRMAKGTILSAGSVGAAIDDGILHIPFKVNSFKMVFHDAMGNAVPVLSNGTSITEQQREKIRQLARGKRFYITEVHCIGPDNIPRTLKGATEVIVN